MVVLSIIIPAYNVEKHIKQTLDSIFVQQNLSVSSKIEVIVVNDGSTDLTLAILNEISQNYAISILNHKHEGAGAARNRGIKAAKGEYLLFLDGDDLLQRNSLDTFITYIEHASSEIIVYGMKFCNIKNNEVRFSPIPQIKHGKSDEVLLFWLNQGVYTALRDKVVLREYILENELFFIPNIIYEDVSWTIKLFAYNPGVEYSGIYLYENWIRGDSVTNVKKSYINLRSHQINFNDLEMFMRKEKNLSNTYLTILRIIMSGIFFELLSMLNIKTEDITAKEQKTLINFLEEKKYIMKYSQKINRKYFYRVAANVFGIKLLSYIKR